MALVENYKLEVLLRAIGVIQAKDGLDLSSSFKLAHISKRLETLLVPFNEKRREIVNKYATTDETTGKPTIDQNDPKFLGEMAELNNLTVEFETEPLQLNVKKGETVFTVQLVRSFMDIYGDDLKIEEY